MRQFEEFIAQKRENRIKFSTPFPDILFGCCLLTGFSNTLKNIVMSHTEQPQPELDYNLDLI